MSSERPHRFGASACRLGPLLLSVAALAGLSALGVEALGARQPGVEAVEDESAKELIHRYFTECFAVEAPGCLEEYWSEQAAVNIRGGAERRRALFPDVSYSLEELIAEGDRVVAIFRVAGTAAGVDGSHPRLDHREVAIYRVRDGRITDGEVIANLLDVARALGHADGSR